MQIVCEQNGDIPIAHQYRSRAIVYTAAIERSAWDGAWYRRATYDNGTPIGSILSPECQIDSIAQSWAVLSGAGNLQRSRQAMHSVMERLVNPVDRLTIAFCPTF